MENVEQQNVAPIDSAKALRVQLGELLQRARLNQQKDGVDVARRLMLSKLQLFAIEAGQVESFHHERRYVQALKSYVAYLNLDHDPTAADLLKQVENHLAVQSGASPAAGVAQLHLSAATPTHARTYAARRPKFISYTVGVFIVGAIALAISEGWPFFGQNEKTESIQTAQDTAPVSAQATASNKTEMPATTQSISNGSTVSQEVAIPSLSASASAQRASVAATTPPVSTSVSVPGVAQTAQNPQAATPQAATPQAVNASQPAAVNEPARMRIDFSADCWVSLQTEDGKKVERIYKQGQHLEVPAASVSALILGNAPAAKMTVGDRQIDIMAKNITQGNITRLDQKGLQALQKNSR